MNGITDELIDAAATALAASRGLDFPHMHESAKVHWRPLGERFLKAFLIGRAVVDLPEPDAETQTLAAWRPRQQIIEAYSDLNGIPLVRYNGSTAVAYIARETASAVIAASYRAEGFAATRSAERASGVAGGDAR